MGDQVVDKLNDIIDGILKTKYRYTVTSGSGGSLIYQKNVSNNRSFVRFTLFEDTGTIFKIEYFASGGTSVKDMNYIITSVDSPKSRDYILDLIEEVVDIESRNRADMASTIGRWGTH